MWKQKVGISVGNGYSIPSKDVIELVGRIGFEAVSLALSNGANIGELVDTARNCGLTVQSLHAPISGSAAMWNQDETIGIPARDELLSVLDACAQFQIPIMVAHVWIGFNYTFDTEGLHFANYDAVVAHAKKLGVKIAFENTEGEEYLFALMDRYKDDDTVGFCWDSGHEMCYNRSRALLKDFGDRLLVTHLNDNLGIRDYEGKMTSRDDLHLLPYDGIGDWDEYITLLKSSKPVDVLNFEVGISSKRDRHENDRYQQMPLENYFTEAYNRACRIAYRYSK